MSDGLNVIILDDDPEICQLIFDTVKRFYSWGEVIAFTDFNEAMNYCKSQVSGVAIFILDVFMGEGTSFMFLDRIVNRFPMAYEDTIIVTGNASDDIVNMCVASDITYLLEKPIKPYALQLAVRAIVAKYIKFAKRLLQDSSLAENISKF